MSTTFDDATLQQRFAALPTETYDAGRVVLAAGTTTGRLLILRDGAVEVVKDGVPLARIDRPGELFGELSALLDQPHSANVRALRTSVFGVAAADRLLDGEAVVARHVAMVMARRLDAANGALAEARRSAVPRTGIAKVLDSLAAAFAGDPSGGPASWYCTIPAHLLAGVRELPLTTVRAGQIVLRAGARTGELLVLCDGVVEVRRDGVTVARVAQPGEVFGELALLLGRPHTAEVRAVETATFHRADGAAFLDAHPGGAAYVAAVVARRLLAVDRALVDAKGRVAADRPDDPRFGVLDRLVGVLSRGW